jgi:hypothetical protein
LLNEHKPEQVFTENTCAPLFANYLNSAPLNYGPASYNSGEIPVQPGHLWQEDSSRSGIFRTTLNWGNYANLDPWQDVDAQLQLELQNTSKEDSNPDHYINHQRWRFETSNILLTLLPLLKWWSIIFIPWILWGFAVTEALSNVFDNINASKGVYTTMSLMLLIVATTLSSMAISTWMIWRDKPKYKKYIILVSVGVFIATASYILTPETVSENTSPLKLIMAMLVTVFMGLAGWDFVISFYLRLLRAGVSELNRKTGMLTVARPFRSAFTAPFYEFDATMELRPAPHGNSSMAVWLHHRYSSFEIFLGGKVQSLGMSREECMAFWDTLQRYMDVTQPLPELPILEQFRHLDPTTVAHDKLSNRPPRRWRDTKYKVWDRTERPAMMNKNLNYPWQTEACILTAKIDSTLSIEDYYHSQEKKGIKATPKATDYDNIHRG